MKLAICIPAYYAHLKYLPEVLESISNQSVKPYLISISVSSVPLGELLNIPQTLNSTPILVSTTDKQQYAAANRNIAGIAALNNKDVEGLVFFDIDDYMHPQYLEKVTQAFEENADVFLHNYYNWQGRSENTKDIINTINIHSPTEYASYFESVTKYDPSGKYHSYGQITSFDKNDKCIDTHNGHVSLKRFVFEREKFDEDTIFRRTEDCHYNFRLLKEGYNILVSKDQLSLYYW